jgi:5-oxoprolinase (ATP-hydrolysing)
MAGGEDGKRGVNIWNRKDPIDGTERVISVGGKASMAMNTGDRIVVKTPGGGGYGVPENKKKQVELLGEFEVRKMNFH